MPQFLKIILFLLAINAVYIGAQYLARKIRKNAPVPKVTPLDENKMKRDLMNERFEGCDDKKAGCGLQCPLAQYCNPRYRDDSKH